MMTNDMRGQIRAGDEITHARYVVENQASLLTALVQRSAMPYDCCSLGSSLTLLTRTIRISIFTCCNLR